ncbi:MAG TPA: hypothetical protein GX695_02265 [Acholeplasmataceae bacterium]|nr:hypothetical protein [Acholeplasmataceae bacterium]
MTKLIIDLQKINKIKSYEVDGLIINLEGFSTFNGIKFSLNQLDEITKIIKSSGKKIFINIDRLYGEDDLGQLYELFNVLKNIEYDYIIFSDFAVYYYFNKNNDLKRLIYDAKTMGTNTDDLNFYKEKNIKVFVANELSKKQIKLLSETNNGCFEVFGYHQIFYSKRPILSLFQEFDKIEEPLNNSLFEIKELSKDVFYKIYESELGIFVYTDYIYCAYKEIKEFVNNFSFIKINPIFLSEENLPLIISYYRDLIKNINVIENDHLIKEIYPNTKSGFLLKKSVVLKEDFNE